MGWLATTPELAPVARRWAPPAFQAPWATEQEWLVDRITRDIRAMAAFARQQPLPAADAPAVKPESLRFEEHLFSPRSYEAVAREALGPGTSPAAPSPNDSREDARLLSSLLDPQAGVLISEDATLSRALAAEPSDPGAHERAALLVSAFALTDCTRGSTDTRPALTRITAHLALARALRGGAEPGLAGRFAEAALVTLVGRDRDARARLEALAAGAPSPAERAWLRALRLRNTADFRIARDEKRLTPLETLEEFRALVHSFNDEAALDWLDTRALAPAPEWGRIALDARAPTVGTHNRYAQLTLALDLAQTADVITRLRGTPSDEASFFEALNERPGASVRPDAEGKPRIDVLGLGLWADRLQRNLICDLTNVSAHYGMLGQPGERKAFAEQARARFGRLALYPIVLRENADEVDGYRRAMAAVRELAVRSPERLTGDHWWIIRKKESFAPVPRDLPDQNAWFRPALPPGTLLDVEPRLEVTHLAAIGSAELAALRELAPYNVPLAVFASGRQPDDKRSAADLAAFYGPPATFQVRIMGRLGDAAWYDPPDYRKRQGALCELSADYCRLLGYRLAELGFADEAAVAYQKFMDGAHDRVAAANNSRWLVDYYFDHGQTKKAEKVARSAAEVYSGEGLFTMARLMERMGRLREAEEYYRILDRYDDATDLAGFHYRQARVEKKPEYEPKFRDALALALPAGLETFDRAALPPSPSDGVVIKGGNDNTKRYDIQWGHVIVGLDGFRVRSVEAYSVVRALSQSPRMKLVIWRGKSYDDVEVELWDRQFRVDIETLGASPSPKP